MTFIRHLSMVVGVFLLPLSATADDWDWTGLTKVEVAYPHASGYTLIVAPVNGQVIAPQSACPGRLNVVITHPNYDALVATILTALSAKLDINIFANVGATNCGVEVNRLQIFTSDGG